MTRASSIVISAEAALVYHVDGEPHLGGRSVKARIHPGALRVLSRRLLEA
jgi:diacylglycerol kinase family enzyme